MASAETDSALPSVATISSLTGATLSSVRHEGDVEALAGEAPGYRRAEPGSDTRNRGHLAVHTPLLVRSVHALPFGNSYASSDSFFISML